MEFKIPAKAQKIAKLFPPLSLKKDFFSEQEVQELRMYFSEHQSEFVYKKDDESAEHSNCRLRQTQVPSTSLRFVREKFQSAYEELSL